MIYKKKYTFKKYEGEWLNNKREGKGTMYFCYDHNYLKYKYEGEW